MNNIKLLALDLDGTLTNSKKEISETNKNCIKKVQENGTLVVITTGRPFVGVKPIADKLNLWDIGGYIIANNGVQIIDCSINENISNLKMPISYIYELLNKSIDFNVYPLMYNDEEIITETSDNMYVQKEAFNNNVKIKEVSNIQDYIIGLSKFMIVGEPYELMKFYNSLNSNFENKLNIFFSEPYFMEVAPTGIEKGSRLSKLANMLGYTKNNVMACGDGLNDIPMLKYAGISVAMKNAYDEVKKYASYISDTNDNDGVAKAIKKFILMED